MVYDLITAAELMAVGMILSASASVVYLYYPSDVFTFRGRYWFLASHCLALLAVFWAIRSLYNVRAVIPIEFYILVLLGSWSWLSGLIVFFGSPRRLVLTTLLVLVGVGVIVPSTLVVFQAESFFLWEELTVLTGLVVSSAWSAILLLRLKDRTWGVLVYSIVGIQLAFTLVLAGLILFAVIDIGETSISRKLFEDFLVTGTAFSHLVLSLGLLFITGMRRIIEAEAFATLDPLTEALNRRGMEYASRRLLDDAGRYGVGYAVIMIDIDHFKQINDQYGHAVGDQVLQRLVRICLGNIRSDTAVARYGGEEFCVLLPNCGVQEAYQVAERIRLSFFAEIFSFQNTTFSSTISMGVAGSQYLQKNDTSIENSLKALIEHADSALYQAKHSGRNRSEIASVNRNNATATPSSSQSTSA